MTRIGLQRETALPQAEAVARLREALQEEGFGVLTRIDVRETLKQKLGVEFRPYEILGACNPSLAHRALSAVAEVGVLLPCNLAVYEGEGGKTVVVAVDPLQTIAAAEPSLGEVAAEVRRRLARVLEKL